MSTLIAENLVKSFGRRTVVDGVSLAVSGGEIVGLLGRNGAGKTTTFLMMAGLLRPEAGRILLDGQDITSRTTAERGARGVVFLPQESSVFLKASAEDNLRMVLELRPGFRRDSRRIALRSLEDLGLAHLARQPAHSLSGGERRRLEIARALSLGPAFLLLDEPFTGVDPRTVQDLQRIFLALAARGIGLVVSDHNVRETFQIVTRAVIVDGGRVLVEGSPEALAEDGKAQRSFLGKEFRLGGEASAIPGR